MIIVHSYKSLKILQNKIIILNQLNYNTISPIICSTCIVLSERKDATNRIVFVNIRLNSTDVFGMIIINSHYSSKYFQ